jgi:hypothetical protein
MRSTVRPPTGLRAPDKSGSEETNWENVWSGVRRPIVRDPRRFRELDAIFHARLETGPLLYLGAGSAPCFWMAYYLKYFKYGASGEERSRVVQVPAIETLQRNVVLGDAMNWGRKGLALSRPVLDPAPRNRCRCAAIGHGAS